MKLILLYGPPAVGKFTVARELASLTGFKLFHNHLSVDLVESVFPRGTPSFGPMINQIRELILAEAAKTAVAGVILTFVYERPRQQTVERYAQAVERHGGQLCLVQLTCDEATLYERVTAVDRQNFGKITEETKLTQKLAELDDPFALVPGRESLVVDTAVSTPRQSAQTITGYFNLPYFS